MHAPRYHHCDIHGRFFIDPLGKRCPVANCVSWSRQARDEYREALDLLHNQILGAAVLVSACLFLVVVLQVIILAKGYV